MSVCVRQCSSWDRSKAPLNISKVRKGGLPPLLCSILNSEHLTKERGQAALPDPEIHLSLRFAHIPAGDAGRFYRPRNFPASENTPRTCRELFQEPARQFLHSQFPRSLVQPPAAPRRKPGSVPSLRSSRCSLIPGPAHVCSTQTRAPSQTAGRLRVP